MPKVVESHPARASALIGLALAALGCTTMLGWLLQVPAMVDIVQDLDMRPKRPAKIA